MILGLHPIKYSLIQLAFDLKVLAALNWQTTRTYQMPCSKWNIFLARSCHIELLCPSVGSLYHFKIRIQAKLSYADIEMTSQLRFQKRILIIEVAAHMLEKEIHTDACKASLYFHRKVYITASIVMRSKHNNIEKQQNFAQVSSHYSTKQDQRWIKYIHQFNRIKA